MPNSPSRRSITALVLAALLSIPASVAVAQPTGSAIRGAATTATTAQTAQVPVRIAKAKAVKAVKVTATALGANKIQVKWSGGKRATRFSIVLASNKAMTKDRKVVTVSSKAKRKKTITTKVAAGKKTYVQVIGKNTSSRRASKVVAASAKKVTTIKVKVKSAGVDKLKITWSGGSYADAYDIVLATHSNMTSERKVVTVKAGGTKSKTVTTPEGSGSSTNQLTYVQVIGRNAVSTRTSSKAYGKPSIIAPASSGLKLTVGTLNVNCLSCSRKYASIGRTWGDRRLEFRDLIASKSPDILALQEATTANITASDFSSTDLVDQSLLGEDHFRDIGNLLAPEGYAYTHMTEWSEVDGDVEVGTRGSRILYKTSKYELVASEMIALRPLVTGYQQFSAWATGLTDAGRTATWARLKDKSTGSEFYVVSVHLAPTKDKSSTSDIALTNSYNVAMVTELSAFLDDLNTDGVPIVLMGDLNGHQNRTPDGPQQVFYRNGYYDTSGAKKTTNLNYLLMNNYSTTMKSYAKGAARIDYILVKNTQGARWYENVNDWADPENPGELAQLAPSDHNLQLAGLTLKTN